MSFAMIGYFAKENVPEDRMSRKIYITEPDMHKLRKIVDNEIEYANDQQHLHDLKQELMRAKVVANSQLPADVISMNSQVSVLLDGAQETISLVYPHEADVSENKLSVLSPIGTAILGYREGDAVAWPVPSGCVKVEIKKVVFQPEAAQKAIESPRDDVG
jgi:regulator of nucleoside diphosphate kinase